MINSWDDRTLTIRLCHYTVSLFFLMVLLLPCESRADSAQEIAHLLSYIEHSGCTFLRNGKEYTSAEARTHIQNKYEYAKSRVKTAEDFIHYAATVSSMSGKPYKARCNGNELLTAEWLAAELHKLRQN